MSFYSLGSPRPSGSKVILLRFACICPHLIICVIFTESSSHGHSISYRCTGCSTSRRIPAPPTLGTDAIPSKGSHQSSSDGPHPGSVGGGHIGMDVDAETLVQAPTEKLRSSARVMKATGAYKPQPLPHFAKRVGHVTFLGNERLPDIDTEIGSGIYVA